MSGQHQHSNSNISLHSMNSNKSSSSAESSGNKDQTTLKGKLKAIKRRGVQKLLEAVKVTGETIDDTEYINSVKSFDRLIADLNEFGAGMSECLEKSRLFYTTCTELSGVMKDFYWGRLQLNWDGMPNQLTLQTGALKYNEAWELIDQEVRRSTSKVWIDTVLSPMRNFMEIVVPNVNKMKVIREECKTDMLSYQRRVQHNQSRLTNVKDEKKGNIENEINKFQEKYNIAKEKFDLADANVMEEFRLAKISRDQLIELTITEIVSCQTEMFSSTSKYLEATIINFPQDKVSAVRKNIVNLIQTGGPEKLRKQDLDGGATKAKKIITGEATFKDYKAKSSKTLEDEENEQVIAKNKALKLADKEMKLSKDLSDQFLADPTLTSSSPPTIPSRTPPPVSPRTTTTANSQSSSPRNVPKVMGGNNSPETPSRNKSAFFNDLKKGKQQSSPIAAPAPAPVPVPEIQTADTLPPPAPTKKVPSIPVPKKKVDYAVALFDNEAENEGELSFGVGDRFEILAKDDSGWWQVKLNGKVGIVPANYLQEESVF